jgi:hypothetical protein
MNLPQRVIAGLIILLAVATYGKHHLETSWETFKLENNCYVTAVKEGERNVPHAVGRGVIMIKGPDMQSWDCDGQIIWKEVKAGRQPS